MLHVRHLTICDCKSMNIHVLSVNNILRVKSHSDIKNKNKKKTHTHNKSIKSFLQ